MGWSLGIDLVPFKTCSFDCGFCQVGATPEMTLERREYVPTSEVIAEITAWLAAGGQADFLTLSGAGEPTLHSRFGDILRSVPAGRRMRTALLSNGSLFYLPDVRRDAASADVVKVSFSAWDEASFRLVNRPHPALRLEAIAEGLRTFRRDFKGTLWAEVFLVRGLNDRADQVARIAGLVHTFAPDQVQLNTVARPPADPAHRAVDSDILAERARLFGFCEVVCAGIPSDTPSKTVPSPREATPDQPEILQRARILSLVQRHPSTLDEIAQGLGLDGAGVQRILDDLCHAGHIEVDDRSGRRLWKAAAIPPPESPSPRIQ